MWAIISKTRVTQCGEKLIFLCRYEPISGSPPKIIVFGPTNAETPENLLELKDLQNPSDILACTETRHLYSIDRPPYCVWRVSLDGLSSCEVAAEQIRNSAVHSMDALSNVRSVAELVLYGSDEVEQKRISNVFGQ